MVAIHLCRTYGRDKVSYYKNDREIDFVVAEKQLAIQVSYSIEDEDTLKREVAPLTHFAQTHSDWRLQVITFDEQDTLTPTPNSTIEVIPIWKWLLNDEG